MEVVRCHHRVELRERFEHSPSVIIIVTRKSYESQLALISQLGEFVESIFYDRVRVGERVTYFYRSQRELVEMIEPELCQASFHLPPRVGTHVQIILEKVLHEVHPHSGNEQPIAAIEYPQRFAK